MSTAVLERKDEGAFGEPLVDEELLADDAARADEPTTADLALAPPVAPESEDEISLHDELFELGDDEETR